MQLRTRHVLRRIEALFLPALLITLVCPHAPCQNRHFYFGIDVVIRDDSGELLSVPATVRLYWNGTPCDDGQTSNGRISFTTTFGGKFNVIVEAHGYKPGQGEVKAQEPQRYEVGIDLHRDPSAKPTAGEPILAPKAKEVFYKGMQALREDKLDEAQEALDETEKLAPNNPNVLYIQGVLQLKKHDWPKAQSVLERAAQIDPRSARSQAALGMAFCNQKKYAEAIAPLEKSLQLDSAGGWETHWALAKSYYHTQRYDEALKFSQQAQTESNGQVPPVALLLAEALAAVGRYEESATVLRELLKSAGPEAATAERYLRRLAADRKIREP